MAPAASRSAADFTRVKNTLSQALRLAADMQAAYRSAPDAVRKQFNQAVFDRIWIHEDGVIRCQLASPFAELEAWAHRHEARARQTALDPQAMVDQSLTASEPDEAAERSGWAYQREGPGVLASWVWLA